MRRTVSYTSVKCETHAHANAHEHLLRVSISIIDTTKNDTELSSVDCGYERLHKWLDAFPRERFFIVRHEDLFRGEARRAYILAEINAFLGRK